MNDLGSRNHPLRREAVRGKRSGWDRMRAALERAVRSQQVAIGPNSRYRARKNIQGGPKRPSSARCKQRGTMCCYRRRYVGLQAEVEVDRRTPERHSGRSEIISRHTDPRPGARDGVAQSNPAPSGCDEPACDELSGLVLDEVSASALVHMHATITTATRKTCGGPSLLSRSRVISAKAVS